MNEKDRLIKTTINFLKEFADKGYENAIECIDWFEKLSEQCVDSKYAEKPYTFKSIPRLLEMVVPCDRAKRYCQKLIDSLLQEGYATDAKIVSDCLKQMNGEKIAMAVQDNNRIMNDEDYDRIKSIEYLLHELDNHNFDDWFNSLKNKFTAERKFKVNDIC